MDIVLISIAVLAAIALILAVLIQPGKGDMAAGMAGVSGQFSSMFGARRSTDLIQQITMYLAATIAVVCLLTNTVFKPSQESAGNAPATQGAEIPAASAPAPRQAAPQQQPAQQQTPNPTPAGK